MIFVVTSGHILLQEMLEKEQASAIEYKDGKTLSDRVALAIGLLGENMAISRAVRVTIGGISVASRYFW